MFSYNKSITALLVDCLGCTQAFASLPFPLLIDCISEGRTAAKLGGVSRVGGSSLAKVTSRSLKGATGSRARGCASPC